ncbi:receptor-like protein 7 [Gossypium hirsutum]|uniref:Receptor-like protein 7 n=1 Tax=Gossypium hirsutum TaxID=3635 RepID=A0A1U8KH96_GOSHI|nr:receptor-like protein 7 [Gossypium hirsutum]
MENLGFLIALFFLFSSSTSLHPSSHTNLQNHCLDDQRSALLQLQHHLYYAPNFTFSSKLELWDPNTHCCSWKGVTCDALGHVIGIDLSYQTFQATFTPFSISIISNALNLAGNNFNTTLFSYGFGKLPKFTHLNLSASCFHGQIPVGFSHLTRLVSLNLSYQEDCYWRNDQNDVSFDYPTLKLEKPNFKILIKKMRSLRELYLDGVNISSPSSEWCETTSLSLPKLSVLSMSNCDLSGHFPAEFFLLPKMQRLDISGNSRLMGQLPEFPINNSLEVLSLRYTNFSGKLPESISNLKLLRVLILSKLGLKFNSSSGSIPASVANLSNLVELDLSHNNFNGSIHPFHRSGVPNLASLDLSWNHLSGSIPSSLFTLSTLQTLSLGYNSFSDYLLKLDMFFQLSNFRLPDLSNMSLLIGSHNKSPTFPQLETLQLSSCNLTEFPEFIKSQNKLTYLDLSNNRIHGLVPNWLWKSTLEVLHLSSNAIDIPNQFPFDDANSSFPMLRCTSIPDFGGATLLSTLQLNDNKLEGKLLRSLANCTSLKILNLGNNTLHDTFPLWLGKLPRLMVLILRANRFYGPIKHLENNFPALDVLDIASNKFSGKLSIEFFQATHKLRSLKINGNNLEGKLPRFYGSIKFSGDGNAFPMLHILDLASNNFSSEVSIEFFQSLRGMMVIDGNKAKPTLGSLTELESLDLSQNSLSGKIPLQLTSLTFLEVLNLSYNQLDGSIPQRYQFGTFLNNSYIGNTRLCGVPLTKKCNEVGSQMLPQKEGEDSWIDGLSVWKVMLMGYECGLVIGFSIGYTVLNEFGNKWIASFIRKWKRSR